MTDPSLRPNPAGDWPTVDPSAWVDPSAVLIGNVRVGPRTFVGPGAVVRADEPDARGAVAAVVIEAECNIQDGVIIHALAGSAVTVGPRSSLSHGCIVHGPCRVGSGCFVGFRAVLFGADLGDGVFIGSGAIVQQVALPPGRAVAPGRTVTEQPPADALPPATAEQTAFMRAVVEMNQRLTDGYRALAPAVTAPVLSPPRPA